MFFYQLRQCLGKKYSEKDVVSHCNRMIFNFDTDNEIHNKT